VDPEFTHIPYFLLLGFLQKAWLGFHPKSHAVRLSSPQSQLGSFGFQWFWNLCGMEAEMGLSSRDLKQVRSNPSKHGQYCLSS
jgi:hypothetical protein